MAVELIELEVIIDQVRHELRTATEKYPAWPTDPLHALAVVQEEIGECQKEVLQLCYEPEKSDPSAIYREAIQTAVTTIRFLRSLPRYTFKARHQHPQPIRSHEPRTQPLTTEQVQILHHTAERAAQGFYCGTSPDMERLVALGLMKFAGYKGGVPDPYFELTPAGSAALEKARQ